MDKQYIDVAKERERYSALAVEVSSLRQALNALLKEQTSSSVDKPSAKHPKRSYARVASTLRASSPPNAP